LDNFKGRFLRHIYAHKQECDANDAHDLDDAILDMKRDNGNKQVAKDQRVRTKKRQLKMAYEKKKCAKDMDIELFKPVCCRDHCHRKDSQPIEFTTFKRKRRVR